jgi:hypothetical protein
VQGTALSRVRRLAFASADTPLVGVVRRSVCVVVATALAVVVSGCGTGDRSGSSPGALTGSIRVVLKADRAPEFRIYDPSGSSKIEIGGIDIHRSTARVVRLVGSAAVNLDLTQAGELKPCRLTRAVAQRGARFHRQQEIAIAIDGHVYARPRIDYRTSPRGLCGSPAIEFAGQDLHTAQKLVRLIRGG